MSEPVLVTDLSPRDAQAVLQALLDVMGFALYTRGGPMVDGSCRRVVLTRDGEAQLLPVEILLQD